MDLITAKEAYEIAKNFKDTQTKQELDKILALIKNQQKLDFI